jgi:hypothetical protein
MFCNEYNYKKYSVHVSTVHAITILNMHLVILLECIKPGVMHAYVITFLAELTYKLELENDCIYAYILFMHVLYMHVMYAYTFYALVSMCRLIPWSSPHVPRIYPHPLTELTRVSRANRM